MNDLFMAMVAADLDLFLRDFGKEHRVEGTVIVAVFDAEALKERKGGAELGVAESSIMLYAKDNDLPRKRPQGSTLNVDGVDYIVDDWSTDEGMATIALSVATV